MGEGVSKRRELAQVGRQVSASARENAGAREEEGRDTVEGSEDDGEETEVESVASGRRKRGRRKSNR